VTIAWLPPSKKLLKEFFSREKGDVFDGLYALFDRSLLAHISECNATAGARYNFEYVPVKRAELAPDIEVPVNQILVRAGVVIKGVDGEVIDIRKSKIVLAYVPYLEDDV